MKLDYKQYLKFERRQLAFLSLIIIAGCIIYNLETIKPSLFSNKVITLTIEDVRDFCTILGIILIPAGWIYNEYQQRILDQYNSKEKKYQLIIRSAEAFLHEDLTHPKIQDLAYIFIKEFQVCYLYVPDNIIREGQEFLNTLKQLFEEPDEELSAKLKQTLDANNQPIAQMTKKDLYQKLRGINYPRLLKAIRHDMISKTNLEDEKFIIDIPTQIKVKKHFKYIGQTVAHLIILISEAIENKANEKINLLLEKFIDYLKPYYDQVSYSVDSSNIILVTISSINYTMVELLDKLSLDETLGLKKIIELKKIFERI